MADNTKAVPAVKTQELNLILKGKKYMSTLRTTTNQSAFTSAVMIVMGIVKMTPKGLFTSTKLKIDVTDLNRALSTAYPSGWALTEAGSISASGLTKLGERAAGLAKAFNTNPETILKIVDGIKKGGTKKINDVTVNFSGYKMEVKKAVK